MAYTTINKSTDYFNTKLYTGNATDNTAITGVGFQPDLVWIKTRGSVKNHAIFDVIRDGHTYYIQSNTNAAEGTDVTSLKSMDSDGFTLGVGSTSAVTNQSGIEMASWNWKANGTGVANTDGSINSTVSANTTSGFSIVKYTGNDTAGATVGHGLGAIPKMIIIKRYTDVRNWPVYHHSLGNTNKLYLNLTDASSGSTNWNSTTPSDTFFTISAASDVNGGGGASNYIAYCFAEKQGYSKFGSYTGNGSTNGSFIYTGFKPAFVMMKCTDLARSWQMHNNKSDPFNSVTRRLFANLADAEVSNTDLDFLSNGFKVRTTDLNMNGGGNNYIYMAFAEAPLVGDNPATAR